MTTVNAVPATSPYDEQFRNAAVLTEGGESNPYFFHLLRVVSFRESGWNPLAKNPNSSATGLFQLTGQAREDYNRLNPNTAVKSQKDLTDVDTAIRVGRWMLASIMARLANAGMKPEMSNPDFVGATLAGFVLSPYGIPAAARKNAAAKPPLPLTLKHILRTAQATPQIAKVTDATHLEHVARMLADYTSAIEGIRPQVSQAETPESPGDMPPGSPQASPPRAPTLTAVKTAALVERFDSLARRAAMAHAAGKLDRTSVQLVENKRLLLANAIQDGSLTADKAAFWDDWYRGASTKLDEITSRAKWGAGGLILGTLAGVGLAAYIASGR